MTYNRHRTQGKVTKVPQNVRTETCGGSITYVQTEDAYANGNYQATSDTVGANWRNVVKSKGVAVHPFWTRKETHVTSGFSWGITRTGSCSPSTSVRNQTGDWYVPLRNTSASPLVVPESVIERLRVETSTKAKAAMNAAPVEGLVEVYEAKQLGRLAQPLTSLNRAIESVEKSAPYKNYSKGKGYVLGRYLADTWLNYRYGFAPSLRTAHAILAELAKEKEKFDRRTVRVQGPTETARDSLTSVNNTGSNFSIEIHTESTETASCRAGLVYDVWLEQLLTPYGISAMDIPGAAWELIPYSFLVDWVFNVGDVISTLPKPGITQQAAWHGVRRIGQQRITHTATWKSPANFNALSYPNGTYLYTVVDYVRYAYLTTGLTLRVNPLGDWDAQAPNLVRVADLISLIGSKLISGLGKKG